VRFVSWQRFLQSAMRTMRYETLLMAMLLASCGSDTPELAKPPGPDAGGGLPDPGDAASEAEPDGAKDAGEEPLGPPIGAAPAPLKLADDAVTVMGVTSDGQVIYRSSQGIVAIPADGTSAAPALVSEKLGMVEIRGRIVFLFSDVDWAKKVGELTIWTAAHGPKAIGPAVYGENTAFASADGAWVGWIGNIVEPEPPPVADGDAGADGGDEAGAPPELRADLILATPDLAQQHAALGSIGIGSPSTCRPRIDFVGQRVIAAWCMVGSSSALLQTLDPPSFAPVTIAKDANPFWSADAEGSSVFYTDLKGGAWVGKNKLDTGVGWGTLLPDGSAALYTVADQLRRTPLPAVDPTPIITTGFASRAGFTPDYAYALYSTKVSYDAGVRRNLLITPTTKLNTSPRHLLDEPTAEISRSPFTTNGKWVLYLTPTSDGKKTLHARSIASEVVRSFEDVDTAAAGHGSRVLYSTNRSGPETYPITADLAVMDPAAEGDPVTLRTGTTDGRNFRLTSDGSKLVYVMPGQGETPSALFVQAIP
jgi:hypothetical protein